MGILHSKIHNCLGYSKVHNTATLCMEMWREHADSGLLAPCRKRNFKGGPGTLPPPSTSYPIIPTISIPIIRNKRNLLPMCKMQHMIKRMRNNTIRNMVTLPQRTIMTSQTMMMTTVIQPNLTSI
ncbi:hypothetical protein BS47DRAFT_985986 [Hydnum rufescens UP504]|uniref:Uncharacterized protein n=1 Tax=Hydnum rufescens UP504 TaxID=1448309 RepID=A0A9P6ACE5_9AGAM|nr:hypothetical protein BS47DRAFT_985986 [Hydnum rufescens UP504]